MLHSLMLLLCEFFYIIGENERVQLRAVSKVFLICEGLGGLSLRAHVSVDGPEIFGFFRQIFFSRISTWLEKDCAIKK